MNKRTLSILAIAAMLGLLSWSVAQTPKSELFDVKKSQQELEIMRGILSTTLNIVTTELRHSRGDAGTRVFRSSSFSNVGAYYLYGQGATFTIPMSNFRAFTGYGGPFGTGYVEALDALNMNMEAATAEVEAASAAMEATRVLGRGVGGGVGYGVAGGVGGGVGGGVHGGVVGGVPAPPPPPVPPPAPAVAPQAPASPQAPAASQAKTEEMRKRLADAQEQVKKRREEAEKLNQKLQEIVTQLKGYLIEALANYGDSLTVVKPNEYINLVITTDSDFGLFGEPGDTGAPRPTREIISVQRSVITDYKAGRITLDGFKQKVLQYNE